VCHIKFLKLFERRYLNAILCLNTCIFSDGFMTPEFQSTYHSLPDVLFRVASAVPVNQATFAIVNFDLAAEIGIVPDWLKSDQALQTLSGNAALPNTPSLAMAYAGHQFGHFVPSLGDGRAVLIGEVFGLDGVLRDLHLKGAGRTPYSRGGDGRATLKAMLREYIISEAMAALGIPTTRSLAVVATGEIVARERPEPGAVLTRVACSHVRVGTFQYLAVRREDAALQALVDYEVGRNFPDAPAGPERPLWFLRQVISRQATLIAQWMCVGFIHGVMNTDNMSVCGETIDYGPCAFMDAFHPQKVFSSIDEHGRYAWDKQPMIALWNLTRLAETLLPLFDTDRSVAISQAETELKQFLPTFEAAFEGGMMRKLGSGTQQSGDGEFIAATLMAMTDGKADFTNFFVALMDGSSLLEFFNDDVAHDSWMAMWRAHVPVPNVALMQKANPRFIPRNHRVEQALEAARNGDMSLVTKLVAILAKPFDVQEDASDYAHAPKADEEVHATFCGT
jgi:serine/tyrosine/threonine adenylyltransferase